MNRRLFFTFLASAPLLVSPVLASVPRPSSKPGTALPVLVLDPGHGGRDPGAIGLHGTYEKNVVLDIAQEVAAQIGKSAKVKLTRETDKFIALPDRVAFAREAQANLFLSIHADSAPNNPHARGLSAYTLSQTASDDFAGQLAESENIVDERYGAVVKDQEVIASILYDLAAKQTISASRLAKASLVKGAGKDLRLLEQPKRSANFAVLRAPDVPSLLLETGFLSNTEDEKILRDKTQRKEIASVLAREIKLLLTNPLFQ
jgi:N-acetylmuramoyl-L-alanine amidase